jgi:hypothetical protein
VTHLEYSKVGFPSDEKPELGLAPLSELVNILRLFKAECRSKGWHANDNEDWIKVDNEYHNFLCARSFVNVYSFKKVAENAKCLVIEGGAYRVVDVAYTAWFLSEPPARTRDELAKIITENPKLAEKTALYCLNPKGSGGFTCLTLNRTNSRVFKEFEIFLGNKMGVDLKPFAASERASQRLPLNK